MSLTETGLADPTVHVGWVRYEADDPIRLVGRWRDAMRRSADGLASRLVLEPRQPEGRPSATVLLSYAGGPGATIAEADAAIEPLLELGTITEAEIAECRDLEVIEDCEAPPGVRLVRREALLPVLGKEAVAAIVGLWTGPTPVTVAIRSLGGADHETSEALVIAMIMLPRTAGANEAARALLPWHAVAAHGRVTEPAR